MFVAPLVGAWIEIAQFDICGTIKRSLPSWERGLKSLMKLAAYHKEKSVAPLVGAWIEITGAGLNTTQDEVAPLVGAWIEIN